MKRLLDKLFIRQTDNPKWYHIILWWEFRRLIYIVTFGSCLAITLGLFELSGGYPGNPFLAVISIPVGFFLANLFITIAWISELKNKNVNQALGRLLKLGFLFTIVSLLFPGLIKIALSGINSEKYGEPYGHFARHKVSDSEMTGTYKIDPNKADYINTNAVSKVTTLKLNADHACAISHFPIFGNLSNYALYSGYGHWWVSCYDSEHPCEIRILFDSLRNHPNQTIEMYFYIYNNKQPYKLYQMISDPDEGTGVIYERE
jgi:hypothetical protein